MKTVARALPVRSAGLLSAALVAAGVITAGVASAGPPCSYTIANLEQARSAITAAAPGDTLCFAGVNLADVDLTMARSGPADAPITMVSDGQTTIHQLHIIADHILLQGFTIVGGGELLLEGTGIVAQKNTVRDTVRGGIICASCTDSTIESNTVTHATTTGIAISGQRITVRENVVSATVPADDGDADGVRFFGNGHRILSNVIQNIPARVQQPVLTPGTLAPTLLRQSREPRTRHDVGSEPAAPGCLAAPGAPDRHRRRHRGAHLPGDHHHPGHPRTAPGCRGGTRRAVCRLGGGGGSPRRRAGAAPLLGGGPPVRWGAHPPPTRRIP